LSIVPIEVEHLLYQEALAGDAHAEYVLVEEVLHEETHIVVHVGLEGRVDHSEAALPLVHIELRPIPSSCHLSSKVVGEILSLLEGKLLSFGQAHIQLEGLLVEGSHELQAEAFH
jgi:hypothetical protein